MSKAKSKNEGQLLTVFSKGPSSHIEARLRTHNGKNRVALYEYRRQDGQWVRTARGFQLEESDLEDFVAFLDKVRVIINFKLGE